MDRSNWPAKALGVVLGIVGVVLTLGGLWLMVLGGSWYYLLAGLALDASAWFLWKNKVLGVVIYAATVLVSVVWGLFEVGLDGWGLLPWVAGPVLLLLWAVAVVPSLDGARERVRGPAFGVIAVLLLILCAGVYIHTRPRVLQPVPDAGTTLAFDSLPVASGEWPSYGGGAGQQRYADLNQINLSNVKDLKRVWIYHTGSMPKKYGAETTPLKIGNLLYGCTGMNRMYALDPVTGKEVWSYDPKVDEKHIPYTAACRGVAYYATPTAASGTPCAQRIIEGTLDGRLIAVDALNGKPCASFGTNGQVDITVGMGQVIPGMVSINSAPAVVQGVIVTGHQVQDGQYRWAPSGVIQGFDAVTGQLRFAWDVMRPDITTLPPAGQTYTQGTPNMWTTPTGDEQLGLVYLPMGNSGGDYMSGLRRPPENAVSSALVALDVHTGKPRWVFQTVHKDVWDYDLGSQASLIDYPTANGVIPALVLPSKTGEIYIIDRRTGQSLQPVLGYKAPGGGVEPSERAPIQPMSTFATLRKPQLKESDMWGMSPIDQMACRIQYHLASYKGWFTPPTLDTWFIDYPGYNGGSDWGSVAIDPRRGVIVANYNDMPNYAKLITRKEAEAMHIYGLGDPRNTASHKGEDKGAQIGLPYGVLVNAGWRMPFTGMLCKRPPYGWIRAIDLKTGRTLWDHAYGTARRNGPFNIPSMLPLTIGTPNNGGPVVTSGGLVFIAAATDDMISAIDIRTGKTVWQDHLPAGGQATPMIYTQGGKEYLVIMAGGHHFMETPEGDALIAYALPDK